MTGIENKKFQYCVNTKDGSSIAPHVDPALFPKAEGHSIVEPGEVVDHYEVSELLGSTSASEVRLATNLDTGEPVALKLPCQPESADNILHEVYIHRQIGRLPFVATMDGHGMWHERPFIATRAQEGGSLHDLLWRYKASTIRGLVDRLRDGLVKHGGAIDEYDLYVAEQDLIGDGLAQELARMVNSSDEVDLLQMTDFVAEIAQENGHDVAFRSGMSKGLTMRLLENQIHLSQDKMPRDEELKRRLKIMGGATIGISNLHAAGFVHRDIKTANIGIDLAGRGKVIDLGISDEPNKAFADDVVVGTPLESISPEGYRGFSTEEGDVWAVGATTYRALTGTAPIQPPDDASSLIGYYKRVMDGPEYTPRDFNDAVPSEVDDIVMAALHPDFHKRPSIQELQETFEKAA